MNELNITTEKSGPPPGVGRKGRWLPVHLAAQNSPPGSWIVVHDLSKSDAASLRAAIHGKAHQVSTRQTGDDITDVWVLYRPEQDSITDQESTTDD